MPIEMFQHPSESIPGGTFLAVRGSIDSETAPQFERELEKILSQNKFRLIVDLGEVEYVSSAGMGIFIGMIHRFRENQDGDIKVVRAPEKILKVFSAIGLNEMMEFYNEPSEIKAWAATQKVVVSLKHFRLEPQTMEIYCGEPFPIKIVAEDDQQQPVRDFFEHLKLSASQGLIFPSEITGFRDGVWQGTITVTGSGRLTLDAGNGQQSGRAEIHVLERAERAQFPLTIPCQTCQTAMTVSGPDIYRCENCDETVFVDAWGHAFTLKAGSLARRRTSKYKGMDLTINTDINYLGFIRTAIAGLCEKEGMDPVTTNDVALAIEEILLNLIEHGNDFDPWQILKLKMEFQKRQVKIQIRDFGDPYDVTKRRDLSLKSSIVKGLKRGVGTFLVNQLMDQIKYETKPGFNQLTMVKRYGAAED